MTAGSIQEAVVEYLMEEQVTGVYVDEAAVERALAPLDEHTRPTLAEEEGAS